MAFKANVRVLDAILHLPTSHELEEEIILPFQSRKRDEYINKKTNFTFFFTR